MVAMDKIPELEAEYSFGAVLENPNGVEHWVEDVMVSSISGDVYYYVMQDHDTQGSNYPAEEIHQDWEKVGEIDV